MGNDGSGKTTVIKLLEKKLIECGQKVIYVPGYDHLFLDQFKRWYQKLSGANLDKVHRLYDDTDRTKTSKLFYLWPYFVFIDCVFLLLKYWLKPDKIVLFDRYVYDYVISFKNLGVCTALAEFLFLALPKPVYSFVFDISPEIAYERKKYDHKGDIEYYRKQRERYLWLAKNKNILVINTDKATPEEIAKKIFNQLCLKT